jgi:hypothetical protein
LSDFYRRDNDVNGDIWQERAKPLSRAALQVGFPCRLDCGIVEKAMRNGGIQPKLFRGAR